jgi:hypothetical protein
MPIAMLLLGAAFRWMGKPTATPDFGREALAASANLPCIMPSSTIEAAKLNRIAGRVK